MIKLRFIFLVIFFTNCFSIFYEVKVVLTGKNSGIAYSKKWKNKVSAQLDGDKESWHPCLSRAEAHELIQSIKSALSKELEKEHSLVCSLAACSVAPIKQKNK